MENKKELTAGEKLRGDLENLFREYYRRTLSDNVKRAWKQRKEREEGLSTKEIDM